MGNCNVCKLDWWTEERALASLQQFLVGNTLVNVIILECKHYVNISVNIVNIYNAWSTLLLH